MEKKSVRLTRKQIIDSDITTETQIMEAYELSDNLKVFEYELDQKKVTLSILMEDDSVMVKILHDDYRAIIPLQMKKMTDGSYVLNDKIFQFQFFLHKIVCKGVEIYMEYDIFSKQSVISNNTWKIEVI